MHPGAATAPCAVAGGERRVVRRRLTLLSHFLTGIVDAKCCTVCCSASHQASMRF